MNRRNFALSAVALTAMALVPFTACKKDGGGGASGSSAGMLAHMPKDSSIVMGFSMSKATKSAVFKKYQEKIMAGAGSELDDVKEKCGIDVMTDVKSVVLAFGKDMNKPDDAVFAVQGKFDKAKVEKCVTEMGGKMADGVITSPEGKTINAFWLSSDTIIVSKGISADDLKGNAKGNSIKDSKDMMKLIDKVDSGATFWVAGMIPSEAAGMMPPMMGTPPKSGYLSVNVDSGVSAKIGMIFASEDEAKAMSTMVDMGIGMGKKQEELKEVLESVSSSQSGDTLTIKAKVTGDQLTKLEAMAGGML